MLSGGNSTRGWSVNLPSFLRMVKTLVLFLHRGWKGEVKGWGPGFFLQESNRSLLK